MMAEQNIVISELNYKVGQLIEQYIASREQKSALEKEVLRLRQQVQDLEGETQRLNNEIKTLKVANAISAGEGSSEARVRIGQLVREIDKCITLLNS
jgi:outer membrane murein-binding lipoprotein Lpp